MATTRPYFVTHKGIRRLVEATGPAEAASFVVAAEITELRPARGAEVNDWYKRQLPVDIAEKGKPLSAGVSVAPLLTHQPAPPTEPEQPAESPPPAADCHYELAGGPCDEDWQPVPPDDAAGIKDSAHPVAPGDGITERRFDAAYARQWLLSEIMPMEHRAAAGVLEIWDRMALRGTMEHHDFRALRALWPGLIDVIAQGHGVELIELEIHSDEEALDFQDIVTAIGRHAHRQQFGGWPASPAAPFEPAEIVPAFIEEASALGRAIAETEEPRP
ncbi:MAG: hypothetical protein K2X76_05075 [Sphingomonas sp.]|nr:hypothetical protein [Sphingomonas sp.]